MNAEIEGKLKEAEAAIDVLVTNYVRAITPPDRFADRYESLEAAPGASAAIAAILELKDALKRWDRGVTAAR